MDPTTALLLARFRLAAAAVPDVLQARPWYAREGDRIRAMARERGIPALRAIGAAAALSPAGRWDEVLARLPVFMDAVRTGSALPAMPTYSRNVRAAVAILRGERDWIPSGPKVSRFARNLAGDPSIVTIDRWAARVAGRPESGGARWYRELEHAYLAAAAAVGLAPSTFQAILWVAARDYGILPAPIGRNG